MDGGSRLREREEGEECAEGGGEGAMELVFSKDVTFTPWEVGEVGGEGGREEGEGRRRGKEGGRKGGRITKSISHQLQGALKTHCILFFTCIKTPGARHTCVRACGCLE